MKDRHLEAHLASHGCVFFRQGGRHTIYLNGSRTKTAAVPRHNEIKKATVRRICKALDIPEPESW